MISSLATPLRSSISTTRALTRRWTCSSVSASSVVAPRNARTAGDINGNLVRRARRTRLPLMSPAVRALRGATTLDADTEEQVHLRVKALVVEMLERNGVAKDEIIRDRKSGV